MLGTAGTAAAIGWFSVPSRRGARGRVPAPGGMRDLLELRELLLHDLGRQGQVAVLEDDLLAFLAEDELAELPHDGVERLARRPVDVEDTGSGPGDTCRTSRPRSSRRNTVVPSFFDERHRLHAGGPVADPRVADAEAVLGDALDHRGRARLLLDLVLVVAVAERVLLEEAVGARGGVAAVEADRPARPVAGQAELAPGRDVGLVARAGGSWRRPRRPGPASASRAGCPC